MKLNGITCNWYDVTGKDSVEFGLETDFNGAIALDGKKLVTTYDDGATQVAVFDGYALVGIIAGKDGGVKARRRLRLELGVKVAELEQRLAALETVKE